MGDAVEETHFGAAPCPVRTKALLSDFNDIIDRAFQSIICVKYRGVRIPARMREPLVGDRGDGRGTGRDLQDSSTPTAATRHISMPPATEETCHCPHAARVPVCGDNHLLGPSCPPSEQRAGTCATVLAHCSRHCRTGCPLLTLHTRLPGAAVTPWSCCLV